MSFSVPNRCTSPTTVSRCCAGCRWRSGESTLLRCLALLEPVDAGAVFLEGDRLTDRREKDLAAHRSEVGMVFQRFNLFQNMTALGNVMCGLVEVRGLKKR